MNKFDLENIKKNLSSELEKNLKTKINELEQKYFWVNFFEDDNLILNSKIENECFDDDFFNSESDEKTKFDFTFLWQNTKLNQFINYIMKLMKAYFLNW